MSKNLLRFYIALAAVLAAFCAIAFAVPFERTAAFWLSFVFGVLAIGIQAYTMPRAMRGDTRSKFYGFPVLRISFIYFAVQLVLSFLFMALAGRAAAWIPALIYVLVLCAAVVGFVSADAMHEEIEQQDGTLKKDVSTMRAFQSRVANLAISCDPACKGALDRLAEEFRYSDPVSSGEITDIESELGAYLDELQQAVAENRSEDIPALCRRLSLTLAERNRLCKLNK